MSSGDQVKLDVAALTDVRRARKALRTLLTGLDVDDAVVDDIELATSEIVTNALLHGAPPVEVVAHLSRPSLRVEVADRSPERGEPHAASASALSGRGMAIAATLTTRWGIERRGAGKAVWLEFALASDAFGEGVPVRLLGVPIELYIDAQEQLESCIHEVTLLALDEDPNSRKVDVRVLRPLREAMKGFADASGGGRAAAEAARSAGVSHVDLEWRLPTTAAAAAQTWLHCLEELTNLADAGVLLTSAPSAEMRHLRRWLAREVIAQLHEGRPPTAF